MVEAFAVYLQASGVDDALVAIFKAQGYFCFLAYMAGKLAADLLVLEGELPEENYREVALEFGKVINMKMNISPAPSQVASPHGGQAPGGGTILTLPEGLPS